MLTTPLQMLLFAIAGWLNEEERARIEFLQEQVRAFQELHGRKRLRLNDDQRRRLAAKGKRLGRRGLREVVTIVTPATILRWHRELIARKYDGSSNRRPGRPAVPDEPSSTFWRCSARGGRTPTAQPTSMATMWWTQSICWCCLARGGRVRRRRP